MAELMFASLAADNAAPFYRGLGAYLAAALGRSVRLLDEHPWQERERMLMRGEAHVGVVCGLQYVLAQHDLKLLAAPVMRGQRYGQRPVYFSDVVVRSDSAVRSFEDLRGARFAVNEPTSHSGYGIVRYALATRGLDRSFFGSIVETGAHERSLRLILDGAVDAAAIDSTVLETDLRALPTLASRLRTVATLGPSPIPPLVAPRLLPIEVRDACAAALLRLHTEPAGAAVLAAGDVARFTAVSDADYEPIRLMARQAEGVRFDQAAAAALGV